jgi:hypothetical protein
MSRSKRLLATSAGLINARPCCRRSRGVCNSGQKTIFDRFTKSLCHETAASRTIVCFFAECGSFVALRLKDLEGRDRMVIKVAADGKPSCNFSMRRAM